MHSILQLSIILCWLSTQVLKADAIFLLDGWELVLACSSCSLIFSQRSRSLHFQGHLGFAEFYSDVNLASSKHVLS